MTSKSSGLNSARGERYWRSTSNAGDTFRSSFGLQVIAQLLADHLADLRFRLVAPDANDHARWIGSGSIQQERHFSVVGRAFGILCGKHLEPRILFACHISGNAAQIL